MMKKLLGIIVLGLLLSGKTFAESKLIEYKDHKAYTVSTFCIDGYKFVITNHSRDITGRYFDDQSVSTSVSVNTVQFMEVQNGIMVPAKCN